MPGVTNLKIPSDPLESKQWKITFGTVCMNRLHHLQETLPRNIEDNLEYGNVEFVVLDYNSEDGLEDWIRTNMIEHIKSGKLKFFRTIVPEYFNRSHSRNLLFRLSSGEIICNVDADNFLGKGFAEYANRQFNLENNIFLVSGFWGEYQKYKDSFGRFCAKREDFFAISGYDETMTGYSNEDNDLYRRFIRLGRKEKLIDNFSFLNAISHSNDERIQNEFFINNLDAFYISYSKFHSNVLFLYKNKKFETGTLVPHPFYSSPALIKEGCWEKGTWEKSDEELKLKFDSNGLIQVLKSEDTDHTFNLSHKGEYLSYTLVKDERFLNNVMYNYSIITNISKFEENSIKKRLTVNENGFGTGSVFKNFDYENLINV